MKKYVKMTVDGAYASSTAICPAVNGQPINVRRKTPVRWIDD